MPSIVTAYIALGFAIALEVTGSTFLQKSAQFTRPLPTVAMAICYVASFYMLSQALKVLPLGVAYAIWAGLGIILTATVSFFVLRQALDVAAWLGIGLIVAGVVVMNVFSRTVGH
ncbi:multidrug efflux SMR transporter [Rhodopseudomonas sp. BR0M22]|uniref:DMT family transporter n=1 Tax=Rhodopseudomonas sp. BR0M22 TaxID=2269369 RepID=UPI0013E022A9|nr:multidrug efflux SMR transporter [Rhodopseudomonas sp. BR0M22]NEW94095.1 QacE family quaternary ammonium compound efflux SMR transporter [Rhodopseudomonas sp. BR0M22]